MIEKGEKIMRIWGFFLIGVTNFFFFFFSKKLYVTYKQF